MLAGDHRRLGTGRLDSKTIAGSLTLQYHQLEISAFGVSHGACKFAGVAPDAFININNNVLGHQLTPCTGKAVRTSAV